MDRAPRWVRALLALDKVASRIDAVREGLRDEVLLAWIPLEDRAAITGALYGGQGTYLPGGHRFESGLFGWEKRALDAPAFPRTGRVLVGAAGAGRELVALLDRGYEVTAFDPCAPFVTHAREVARGRPATVLCGSYADLVLAAESGAGPLASIAQGPPFDAVILGWGSFSHVLPSSERLALLRSVRRLAPRAPVLLSFMLRPDSSAPPESKGRVRDALRRAFSAMGAPGVSESGDHFFPDSGFFSYLMPDEIPRVAWDAGYEVALFEDGPYPHALFVPLATR
ncbi:class I SAM-dependent methyltransferase [Polyangium aurulentum]|uniref:class I SAM-dependent methyltransferase n=1 Tax=Polyangium aurulentum TaxID=2567896 RepID=UPI0010AEDCF9|nr:class I SAM-dependent methyltransferase [Polyangium aurulentum]UQA55313.1 class I SAM-dependent methyltransferase [Polyangium aurulentum]